MTEARGRDGGVHAAPIPARSKAERRAQRKGGPRVQPPTVVANPDGSLPLGAIHRQTFESLSLNEQIYHYRAGGTVVG